MSNVSEGQITDPNKGRWAHINVKLLHSYIILPVEGEARLLPPWYKDHYGCSPKVVFISRFDCITLVPRVCYCIILLVVCLSKVEEAGYLNYLSSVCHSTHTA